MLAQDRNEISQNNLAESIRAHNQANTVAQGNLGIRGKELTLKQDQFDAKQKQDIAAENAIRQARGLGGSAPTAGTQNITTPPQGAPTALTAPPSAPAANAQTAQQGLNLQLAGIGKIPANMRGQAIEGAVSTHYGPVINAWGSIANEPPGTQKASREAFMQTLPGSQSSPVNKAIMAKFDQANGIDPKTFKTTDSLTKADANYKATKRAEQTQSITERLDQMNRQAVPVASADIIADMKGEQGKKANLTKNEIRDIYAPAIVNTAGSEFAVKYRNEINKFGGLIDQANEDLFKTSIGDEALDGQINPEAAAAGESVEKRLKAIYDEADKIVSFMDPGKDKDAARALILRDTGYEQLQKEFAKYQTNVSKVRGDETTNFYKKLESGAEAVKKARKDWNTRTVLDKKQLGNRTGKVVNKLYNRMKNEDTFFKDHPELFYEALTLVARNADGEKKSNTHLTGLLDPKLKDEELYGSVLAKANELAIARPFMYGNRKADTPARPSQKTTAEQARKAATTKAPNSNFAPIKSYKDLQSILDPTFNKDKTVPSIYNAAGYISTPSVKTDVNEVEEVKDAIDNYLSQGNEFTATQAKQLDKYLTDHRARNEKGLKFTSLGEALSYKVLKEKIKKNTSTPKGL